MIFFYYIFAVMIYIITAPFLLVLSFCKEKYKKSLKSRFFLYKNLKQKQGDIYFHACSFGEIKSIASLIKLFPDCKISTITQTGFGEALRYSKKVNFFPFEIFVPFWMRPCKVLVIFEAELWLMLVFMAKFYNAKVVLLNARISDRSLKNYERFSFFYRLVFKYIDVVFAQSQKDKQRLESLGARNVIAYKNIKANIRQEQVKNYSKPKGRIIIFASTHENEEQLLLNEIKLEENDKLIIAPRHPERFGEVEGILKDFCQKNYYNMQKFSDFTLSEDNFANFFKTKCLLLDTLGELENFYKISDVVFLCGSFINNIGGHNPIEAARWNNIIISGKYYFNQESLYQEVDGLYICENVKDINNFLKQKISQAQIKEQSDLSEVILSIKEGLDARKSL
ncbi:3-deoxy-D-manno-octulosonic acid transferase [Campylobacter ornithocola]|uniref:3-deoxy-D-manno-octulosonic acid transferase n=1 Tax=Campylobacter ornithocola TaxID=1848766 RepID=A0A6M8MYZ0_9BACT|nr:lipid IV(A) 3-deoxy-D-manno-octulosonic acid transferase [Campylobacter ornithocola]OCX42219.1 3-deoxy-D-manno-octulosonic acid transferase [Campylobacter ornithocola]QKF57577.1 3-deoxy-D-manno-octulosonic-acid transferase (KDO transferase) [Campylobacter ornithocola]